MGLETGGDLAARIGEFSTCSAIFHRRDPHVAVAGGGASAYVIAAEVNAEFAHLSVQKRSISE